MDTTEIDYAAAHVMKIMHEFHDIATNIWSMQPPRQDIAMPTHLKPPISKAGLRQLGRLARLKNESKTIPSLHPDTADDRTQKLIHINIKTIIKILNPTITISTAESHK
jgi:hypothetical protein